jgi:glycosyltransferase involved in cell wall biosynthesis
MGGDHESDVKHREFPLVSVVVAVKNAAETVQESVASIWRQKFTDWELLIVDDGSNDGTLEILEQLIRGEPRARLLFSSGLGPAGARNVAISEAKGRYLSILDADDIATRDRLEKQAAVLARDQTLAAVGSAAYHFVRPGIAVGVRAATPTSREELAALMQQGALIVWSNSTMCWRKERLDELGGFDPAFPQAEDAELMNRALYHHGMTILGIPDRLVWYRLSRSSLSSTGLYQQRMIARYLEFRNRCWLIGTPVPSMEEFTARRRTFREKARWARHDFAARLYREAGYRVACGAWRGVVSRVLIAALLHPRYVIRKLWKQRMQTDRRKR